jgi:hypothetical protein
MEVDQAKDPKSMSLDALIKLDKKKPNSNSGKKGKGGGNPPNSARSGASGKGGQGPQGGRPRFENLKKGANQNQFKAKRTGNMISKQNDRNT